MNMGKRTTREMKDRCANWLERNYIGWRNAQPIGEDSITKYAKTLGVPRTALAHWLAGDSVPENDNVIKLANRLGSEIYDILGWEHPMTSYEALIIERKDQEAAQKEAVSVLNIR